MSALVIDGLSAGYGDQTVLADASLEVASGTFTCVIGPSGCGKTTLLRVVAGFEPARAGTVRIGDQVVDDSHRRISAEHRRVGYVPQEGAMFPHLNVAANIGFGIARRSGGRAQKGSVKRSRDDRIEALLAMIGMEGLGGRFPHELSGGQQQRVAVARALAIDPEIVLLDEPFASLDASLRDRLRNEIRDLLRTAGATAILVTHDRAEALSLADQVAVMRDGKLVQAASPRELYMHPADAGIATGVGDATLISAVVADCHSLTVFGQLVVDAASPVSEGPCRLVIRPEQFRLAPRPADVPQRSDGCLGRVERVEYYGHDARVDVRIDGGDDPEIVIGVRVVGFDAPIEGDEVLVTVIAPVWTLPTSDR